MKKVISLALAAVICSASMLLAACGGSTTKTIATVDDLEGAKIGVQLGTTGDIYASDYEEKGSTVERFNKGADAVLALTQGKIDCVIIDSEPAKAFVAANKGLKILDEPFAEEEYAICVAKDNTDLLGKINTALAELKADGTTESIEKNFIGDDTKGKTPYVTPAGTDYPDLLQRSELDRQSKRSCKYGMAIAGIILQIYKKGENHEENRCFINDCCNDYRYGNRCVRRTKPAADNRYYRWRQKCEWPGCGSVQSQNI